MRNRKNFLKNIFGKRKKKSFKTIKPTHHYQYKEALSRFDIPKGDIEIEVEGTAWCKIELKRNVNRLLSLTPRNDYQRENNWPEEGIVNVNKTGSRITTANNWIGYIPSDNATKLINVVNSYDVVTVHARIEFDDNGKSKPCVILMLLNEYG